MGAKKRAEKLAGMCMAWGCAMVNLPAAALQSTGIGTVHHHLDTHHTDILIIEVEHISLSPMAASV
jgi:hypothetical protein